MVVLTGTDLYRDLPDRPRRGSRSRLAHRVIVLQEAALDELPLPIRSKARVVYQSADPRLAHNPPKAPFRVAVIAHLRAEKDPLRRPPRSSGCPSRDLQVVQVGEALDPRLGAEAEQMMRREPRYRWLGGLPHRKALAWMATSHVLVVSSVMEGGANVICEAARSARRCRFAHVRQHRHAGARLSGVLPGGRPSGAREAHHAAKHDAAFYRQLKHALRDRRALFAPAAERRALLGVVRELLR